MDPDRLSCMAFSRHMRGTIALLWKRPGHRGRGVGFQSLALTRSPSPQIDKQFLDPPPPAPESLPRRAAAETS
jgi:hypothetical protein